MSDDVEQPDQAGPPATPAPLTALGPSFRDDLQAHAVKMTGVLEPVFHQLSRAADSDARAAETLGLVSLILGHCSFLAGAAAQFDDDRNFEPERDAIADVLNQIGTAIDVIAAGSAESYPPCREILGLFCETQSESNVQLMQNMAVHQWPPE